MGLHINLKNNNKKNNINDNRESFIGRIIKGVLEKIIIYGILLFIGIYLLYRYNPTMFQMIIELLF